MPADRSDLRNRLFALAAGQSGYFTSTQAKNVGYDYPQQTFHTHRGNWMRVEPKIYRLPHFPAGPHDDLVRASLWSMRKGTPQGVVSHESAAAVHGLGELDPIRTHMTVPRTFRATHPAIVLHRGDFTDPDPDVEQHDGFRVTTPARTLVDVADAATDPDQLDRAVRDALAHHLVTPKTLRAAGDRGPARAALQLERSLSRMSR